LCVDHDVEATNCLLTTLAELGGLSRGLSETEHVLLVSTLAHQDFVHGWFFYCNDDKAFKVCCAGSSLSRERCVDAFFANLKE
jgi:hypothetical protein